MRTRRTYGLVLWVLLSVLMIPTLPRSVDAQDDSVSQFPLAPGATWVYQGTVKWTVGTDVHEADMTWEMTVLDVVAREDIVGYHMRGHPWDLAWYEEGKPPSEYAIIQVGPNRYYRAELDALARLRDESDQLLGLVSEYRMLFDLPLMPGKRFCEAESITRLDGWYCWQVSGSTQVDVSSIAGAAFTQPVDEYTMAYRTNPDHVLIRFVPGLGITHYTYVHHGTVSEVDVQLVEFRSGTP